MIDEKSIDIPILYRDDFIIVVNKPSGMIVHRGWDNDPITVSDVVRDRYVHEPVHALHRLDRGTSGALIFALDADTARSYQTKQQTGEIQKTYLTLVRGPMLEPCVIDHPIPNKKDGERVDAITEFKPIAQKDRWSLVEAIPRTGRLHQIRRHLKHLSHHVVGDVRYGKGDVNRFFREQYDLNRLALHCIRITIDGSTIIDAPLTEDLTVPLSKLGIWPIK